MNIEFCHDELWNANLTWYTEHPKLTKCLSQVAFKVGPFLVFVLLSIFEFTFISQSKNKKICLNNYNILRHLICFFAIYSNLSLLYDYMSVLIFSHNNNVTMADLFGSIFNLFFFVLLSIIYHYQRVKGVITSGILFTVLLLNTVCSSVIMFDSLFYNSSMYSYYEASNIFRIGLCNFCLFIFSFFTDDPIDAGLRPEKTDEHLLIKMNSNMNNSDEQVEISPKQYATFLSKITFYWYTELVKKTSKRDIKIQEIYELEESMKVDNVINKFNRCFYAQLQKVEKKNEFSDKKIEFSSMTLLKVVWQSYGNQMLLVLLLKTLADIFTLCQPKLLELMLNFMKDPNEPSWHAVLIIGGFMMTSLLGNVFTNFGNLQSFEVALNLGTAFSNMVLTKSLRLSPKSKRKRTTGQIINLFSLDSYRFADYAPFFVYIWSTPFQLMIGFYMIYLLLGNAVFVAIAVISLIMISQYFLNRYRDEYINKEMELNDNRMLLINETLAGMKIIKLMAWEKAFIDKVSKARRKQAHYIKLVYYLDIISNWVFFSFSPFLILTSTIAMYIFFIDPSIFTPEKAFVAISIFNILDHPIEELPTLISYYYTCKISVNRLSNFFRESELERYIEKKFDEKLALSITKGRFTWQLVSDNEHENDAFEIEEKSSSYDDQESNLGKKNFELKDIEFSIEKGSFVCIIGAVGSGKSSLISAILGDMHMIENEDGMKGNVKISDDQAICYAAQQAWIQNASFKENILFGESFDEQKYQDTINACALEPDLKQFAAYDETEIGEKGINLSGGQKQRVSLARVCYSSLIIGDGKQVILLDDVLSAVDAHVGKHLCENVLNSKTGLLKRTTRILVTNQLNQLCDLDVDQIILLQEGRIALKCKYDEFIDMQKNGLLDKFDLKFIADNQTTESEKKDEKLSKKSSEGDFHNEENINLENKNLIEEERREEGKVKLKNQLIYFKHFGITNALFALGLMIATNFLQIYSRVTLSDWTQVKINSTDQEIIRTSNSEYFWRFTGLSFAECFLSIIGNIFIVFGVMSTIKLFHQKLLYSIFRSPMSFFDCTPVGRIVNRFSKDIESIDEDLPLAIRELAIYVLRLFSSLILLITKQPNSFIFYLIILVIYYIIMNLYISSSRTLKRYDSTTLSPVYSKVSETLNGISTIRGFGKVHEFEKNVQSKIEVNNRCYWYFLTGNRWLKFNLDMLSNLVLFIVTIQFIFRKDKTTAGDVGLLVTYAMNLTGNLNFLIRYFGLYETNSVSIERLNEYCNNKVEDEWHKNDTLSTNWPQKGEIEFNNYSTRYREGTELVLKNLNFKVNGKEKIGVVGRTGAGKSTITLALFRIIEPVEGEIIIDNVDITQIGLHDLRSKLSIIPQDPILFTGSIRFNLDPFDEYSDDEIYLSLEHAHLKSYVNTLENGIHYEIAEGGENFSLGQRQLVCLARALLRKSKILVLDEATASIDFTTDELVQKTIKSEFKDCTIITIAHRISTVCDSSKILVLNDGKLCEYDEPDSLLKNSNSLFHSLAAKANII